MRYIGGKKKMKIFIIKEKTKFLCHMSIAGDILPVIYERLTKLGLNSWRYYSARIANKSTILLKFDPPADSPVYIARDTATSPALNLLSLTLLVTAPCTHSYDLIRASHTGRASFRTYPKRAHASRKWSTPGRDCGGNADVVLLEAAVV